MPSLNERAAKVMGWAKHNRNTAYYTTTGNPDTTDWEYINTVLVSDWNPVENYNQAMMVRDRCSALGLGERFAYILAGLTDCPASSSDWVPLVRRIAFATAAEITEAAVLTLEGEN